MRILYFDCFAGISGDMILGALLDMGFPQRELKKVTEALRIRSVRFDIKRVKRGGIAGVRCRVLAGAGSHHTSFREIKKLINSSKLDLKIKAQSEAVFEKLAHAEAKIHKCRLNDVAFHEVGAIDSIVDIVGSVAGFEFFRIDKFYSSPLPVNRGWAVTEHGRIPLPAPATMELLKGVPVFNSACEKELITPTGTAILSALCSGFGGMPSMNIEKCGYGAGDYENIPFPDILRTVAGSAGSAHSERMWIVESNIDDMNPQFFETAMEQIFKAGAADIFITPVIMKKGRPGYLLTALTDELHMEAVKKGIFANTTTIGVRAYLVERTVLERKLRTERIGGVPIRFKIAKLGNRKMNEMPEYDDLKNLAVKKDISLKEAYNIAVKTVRNAR